jgi:hypothetical protein
MDETDNNAPGTEEVTFLKLIHGAIFKRKSGSIRRLNLTHSLEQGFL